MQFGTVISKQTRDEKYQTWLAFLWHRAYPRNAYDLDLIHSSEVHAPLLAYSTIYSPKLAAYQCLLQPHMNVGKTNFHFFASFFTLYMTIYVVKSINYFTIISVLSYEWLCKFAWHLRHTCCSVNALYETNDGGKEYRN